MYKKYKIGIIFAFLIVIGFGYMQYQENRSYEKYLSHQLKNDISTYSWSIILNGRLLEDVIAEKSMTKQQLLNIQEKYSAMGESGRFIVDLSTEWLNRVDHEDYGIHPFPVYMTSEIRLYLRRMEEDFKEKDEITLSCTQIKDFEFMLSINDKWEKAILDHIKGIQDPSSESVVDGYVKQGSEEYITTDEYWEYYQYDIVNSDDWIEMVKQMQRDSQGYEEKVEQLYETEPS